jgi:NarL family two-component system response regulator YdfI
MRVFVISAYPTVRAGLAAVVREQPGWLVVGEAAPGAVRALSPGQSPTDEPLPDMLLADLDGIRDAEAIYEWLEALRPRAGLVVLGAPTLNAPSARIGQEAARLLSSVARAAEEQGLAFGALRRDTTPEEISAAIGAVAGGLITLDRRLASDLFALSGRSQAALPAPAAASDEPLTARELEVLQLLAQGLPNKLIAARLHISEHTAKFHVSSIMLKLGAASRTEAVTAAARRGLLIL